MRLIDDIPELERLADTLAGEPIIAADTEAAGYHRYDDSLCLVQISTRDDTWLLDTLALGSLNPIAELFDHPAVEIVFHDADFDLRLLDRDFAIHLRGLFDTQIAARFTGARSFGLASTLERELGVKLQKKYQRADWAQRPLPQDMLDYAAMDTKHLVELRDRLKARLEELGRLAWAEEEFRAQERTRWEPPEDEETAYMRLKKTRDLTPRNLAALREMYRWREDVAKEKDVASFRVLDNAALVAVAREMPRGTEELERVGALSSGNARRWGGELLDRVDHARSLPEEELPARPETPRRPPRDPEVETRVARLKDVRDRAAERLGLDRGFLMPRWQLERIARAAPRSEQELASLDSVRDWQIEALGAGLLDALRAG